LTPEEFQKELAGPSRKAFYLVMGAEPLGVALCLKAAEEALEPGARAFNFHVFRLPEDPVEDALRAARTSSFFSGSDKMVVIKAPDSLKAGGAGVSEALLSWIKGPVPGATLVLFQEKPDKRLKYVDAAKKAGGLIECPAPARKDLPAWLTRVFRSKGLTITAEAARVMADRAGDSLQSMVNEAEKLSIWPGPGKPIGPEIIRQQVPLGSGCVIYELAEPVAERRPQGAVPVLLDLLGSCDAYRVISALTTHMRRILAAKISGIASPLEGRSPDDAMRELGLAGYYLTKIRAQASRWSLPELREASRRVEDAYRALYTTRIPPEIVLEELCLKLSLPAPPGPPPAGRGL
jgi:DNA polymerase III delta subunit